MWCNIVRRIPGSVAVDAGPGALSAAAEGPRAGAGLGCESGWATYPSPQIDVSDGINWEVSGRSVLPDSDTTPPLSSTAEPAEQCCAAGVLLTARSDISGIDGFLRRIDERIETP
jgi:hypothetical protein